MNNNDKMKAVFEVLKNGFDNLKANGEVGIKFSLEKEFENSLGCIYADKNFDIIVDWKYRKSQTELILYDINNESFCLSLVNKIQLTQTSQMNKMNNLL